jgi:hypothetical protein
MGLCQRCGAFLVYKTVPSRADNEAQPLVTVCPTHGENYRLKLDTRKEQDEVKSWTMCSNKTSIERCAFPSTRRKVRLDIIKHETYRYMEVVMINTTPLNHYLETCNLRKYKKTVIANDLIKDLPRNLQGYTYVPCIDEQNYTSIVTTTMVQFNEILGPYYSVYECYRLFNDDSIIPSDKVYFESYYSVPNTRVHNMIVEVVFMRDSQKVIIRIKDLLERDRDFDQFMEYSHKLIKDTTGWIERNNSSRVSLLISRPETVRVYRNWLEYERCLDEYCLWCKTLDREKLRDHEITACPGTYCVAIRCKYGILWANRKDKVLNVYGCSKNFDGEDKPDMVILGFMHNDNLHPSDCFRITDNDFSRTDISQFVNNTTSEHLTFNPYNLLSGEFLMSSWRQVMVGDQKSIRIIRSPTGGEINEYSLRELFDRLIINMCISICETTNNL